MQNQSFRVQVWASDGGEAAIANDLFNAVRSAVLSSAAYKAADPGCKRLGVHDGEWSAHFTVAAPQAVKQVDDSETLVVEMSGHDQFAGVQLENFQWFERRVEWGKGSAITSVSFDVQFPSGAHETKTYVVGRNGVTAIRIERGARRG